MLCLNVDFKSCFTSKIYLWIFLQIIKTDFQGVQTSHSIKSFVNDHFEEHFNVQSYSNEKKLLVNCKKWKEDTVKELQQ